MALKDCFWSFYNRTTEVRLDGLRTAQAQQVATGIPKGERDQWLVWQEGLDAWQSLRDKSELFLADGGVSAPKPPAPAKMKSSLKDFAKSLGGVQTATDAHKGKGQIREIEGDFEYTGMSLSHEAFSDVRAHTRVPKNYTLSIKFDEQTFQCKTIDVSMGGMQLDTVLPPEVLGKMGLVIIYKNNIKLKLRCIAVPELKAKGSKRLIIQKNSDPATLKLWLLEPGVV